VIQLAKEHELYAHLLRILWSFFLSRTRRNFSRWLPVVTPTRGRRQIVHSFVTVQNEDRNTWGRGKHEDARDLARVTVWQSRCWGDDFNAMLPAYLKSKTT
jgi:hypothetical protein